MHARTFAALLTGTVLLGACASTEERTTVTVPGPLGPGAIVGTQAADRNGDGIVDGYYSADGVYHQHIAPPPPPCPEPAPMPPRPSGERG
jgi:hypothetical protein